MPHIDTPGDHRYPWYVRLIFALQRRKYGRELEPARIWGRAPRVFAALSLLYGMLDRQRSPIEPELRSLVTVRVSQINWCEFCVDLNSATAMNRGASCGKLDALATFRDSPLFSARERAALELAEAMTYTGRRVEGEILARLKVEFDDDALVELAGLIAFQNLSSKFNAALDVPAQGFCRTPSAEPQASGRGPLTMYQGAGCGVRSRGEAPNA